ncbi:hypothetical protein [Ottowia testudinis]|uniref:Uncharacterized protein n=1 Tax=Ottowia testudinis TaxID=2816950 RepID=A0A975CDF1_9BURK|nr:hypothetical protein [Ottowia testudinis]QTD44360.1 hypothetical protein J1M35_14770 [Ottowia testudinis]
MNLITLQHALARSPADYAAAPLDAFKQLVTQTEQLQAFAKAVKEFAEQASELRYAEQARHRRQAEGRDFGTIRLDDHGNTVVCDQRKIIDWDQAKLAELAGKIAATGDNPAEYLDISYKVAESKYKAWPATLREQFAPARTERPGKTSYSLMAVDAGSSAQNGGV